MLGRFLANDLGCGWYSSIVPSTYVEMLISVSDIGHELHPWDPIRTGNSMHTRQLGKKD